MLNGFTNMCSLKKQVDLWLQGAGRWEYGGTVAQRYTKLQQYRMNNSADLKHSMGTAISHTMSGAGKLLKYFRCS